MPLPLLFIGGFWALSVLAGTWCAVFGLPGAPEGVETDRGLELLPAACAADKKPRGSAIARRLLVIVQ